MLAGFLTVVPAGGRVGGLLREPPVRVDVLVLVLEAEVEVVPGRRTVDAEAVLPGRFVPSALEPFIVDLEADDLAEDLGESEAPVPAVSSPERIDSSFWTTSKPSVSDMSTELLFLLKET